MSKRGLTDIVPFFLELEGRLRLQHWNTRSQSRHKASCQAIAATTKSMDLIVEALLGRLERPLILGAFEKTHSLQFAIFSDDDIVKQIQNSVQFLQSWTTHPVVGAFPDILNLRDDLVGNLNTVLYLMTLA